MRATHFEFLVEEPSMEAYLCELLPKVLPTATTFTIHIHQGKHDLLRQLERRLRGYSKWLPAEARIVVLVDRDNEECRQLKQQMEVAAQAAGLATRTSSGKFDWRVVNRIAIEELEAWFFGDWEAVSEAYSRVPRNLTAQAAYRNPDGIAGGTWEAFERILKRAGYFEGGLRKVEAARNIGRRTNANRNYSPSFTALLGALSEAIS